MLLLYAQYLRDVFMLSSIYGTPDRKTMTAVVAAATAAGDGWLFGVWMMLFFGFKPEIEYNELPNTNCNIPA